MAPMSLGQAAGVAAVLAASGGVPVQYVPYDELRRRLLDGGQIISLALVPAKGAGRP
jgi:hypothetical protein